MNLPNRFTESAFRRYEAIIANIIDSYPAPVTINPKDIRLSCETVSARLRDAITSYRAHRWESTVVDDRIDNMLISVRVLPNGLVVASGPGGVNAVNTTQPTKTAEINLNETPIKVLCLLAASRLLTRPVKVFPLLADDANVLEGLFDVSLTKCGDATYILR